MINIVSIIIVGFFYIILPVSSEAASAANNIQHGNRLYEQGKYDDAVKAYLKAREESPGSDIANFNLGSALYKKGRYQEAIDAFTKSLNTEDRRIEADAIYNMANAGYKLGSQLAEQNPGGAVNLYRQSINYYKRALELDQENDDARYNLELIRRELKKLEEELKNQPEKQQWESGQEQKEGKGKEQESQSGQKKQNVQEKQDEDREHAEDYADKQQAEQKNAQRQDKGGEKDAGQYVKEKSGMTPEEAGMLLDAFGDEGSIQDLNKQQGEGYYPGVMKNW